MSSETDHPRQRTVAELLAAHGDSSATGRRHRRRAPEGPEENGAPPAQPSAPAYGGDASRGGSYSGDSFGGNSFGNDSFGGDSYGGDPFDAYGGDPYPQDARGSDPRAADPRAADPRVADPRPSEPRAAEPRSRETYGADGYGSDAYSGDTLGSDTFGNDAFAPDAFGGHGGASDWRSAPAAPLADRPRSERAVDRTGPDRSVLREPVRDPMVDRSVLREPVPRDPGPPLPRTPEPDVDPPRPAAPRGSERDFRADRPFPPQPTGTQALAPPPYPPPNGAQPTGSVPFNGHGPNGSNGSNGTNGVNGADATQALAGPDRAYARPPSGRAPADPYPADPYAEPYGSEQFGPSAEHDRSTDELPRIRDSRPSGMLDPGLTGPIDVQRRPMGPEWQPKAGEPDDFDDDAPTAMVGVAPAGAESWQRPGQARRGAPDDEGGPPTQASKPMDFDDHPAGLDSAADLELDLDDEDGAERPRRRLGRGSAESSPGQAWAAVVAQWIIGAVGGAALWVGFRFLWRELPVVALAAAVLVTIGLVVVVRALLRNSDMRTTLFAVGVGLLLTVSPAILVLFGR